MFPKAFLIVLLIVSAVYCSRSSAQQPIIMNPNDIQFGDYRHNELPAALLPRIRATTDVFGTIDGVTYKKAVDLYKRDLDPEANLIIWEEMAKAYKSFCSGRCSSPEERMDVYRVLLLRSMFNEQETLAQAELKILRPSEAKAAMRLYTLPEKPIEVVRGD